MEAIEQTQFDLIKTIQLANKEKYQLKNKYKQLYVEITDLKKENSNLDCTKTNLIHDIKKIKNDIIQLTKEKEIANIQYNSLDQEISHLK